MRLQHSFLKIAGKGWSLLRDAYREFQANDPLRMAGATSFFASFALPPIMIILIRVFGLFADERTIRHNLFDQLGKAMNKKIASQVHQVLKNVHELSLGQGLRIGGFIFLLFVATTLFEVIRSSLNQLWKIRLKGDRRFGTLLLYRVRSMGIILIAGLLFFVALLVNTTAWLLPQQVDQLFNHVLTTVAGMSWFTLVLRFLSYGRPAWKTAAAGGIFTGMLFTIGEVVLHVVLSGNNMQTIYGASTSLVLLLLFVFYCSFIFYFGACFTAVLAIRTNRPIRLTRHAMRYAETSAAVAR
jgi:membrane protein